MTLPIADAAFPSPDEIRATLLSALRFAYLRLNITRNVLPGSDDYVRIDKLAGRVSIAIANGEISAENTDPLRAQGDALVNLAGVFGVYPRPAAGGAGAVNTTFSGATLTLPSQWTGTALNGKKYTATPGTYASGAPVPVLAVSAGTSTNQIAGTIITWDSAAIPTLDPTATVTSAGITGGSDQDDQETLRARLLERLAAAAGGGNWSQVVQDAQNASASVEAAYDYPAVEGPASYDLAVTAKGGTRVLPDAIVAIVKAYVLARQPGQQQLTVTSVTPESVDVTFATSLPLPFGAGGDGGGWLDPQPYPAEDCKATAYNSGTGVATINAVASPNPGASIAIWDSTYVDPTTGAVGRMLPYNVATVAGGTGAWLITVQGGFVVSPLGAYLSAGAVSIADYARTFADQVALLGPGQKTALPELLPRAARQPPIDVRAPSDLTDRLYTPVLTTYAEILDLSYALRVAAGTSTPLTGPSLPGTTADPPHVLVLASLAFRAAS